MANVGCVTHLCRYPVKSMGGEEVRYSRVLRSGLAGDRVRVLHDAESGKEVTARQVPVLLRYQAMWTADEADANVGAGANGDAYTNTDANTNTIADTDAGAGQGDAMAYAVQVRTPGGLLTEWEDPELQEELMQLAGGKVLTSRAYDSSAALTGVDDSPILAVTEGTLQRIFELWQSIQASQGAIRAQADDLWRRFRPNVVLRGTEGAAFEETGWIGRRLQLGTAVLQIVKPCERCMMITLDPDSPANRSPELLRLIQEQLDGCFGVYAKVILTGEVRQGDAFRLLE